MSHIFISYSRKDTACVQQTVNRLGALGYRVWFDRTSIPDGDDWRRSIRQGVAGASAALVFWSEHARASEYVRQEMDLALGRQFSGDLKFLTVRLDDAPLDDDIKNYQSPKFDDCAAYGPFERLLPALPDDTRRTVSPLDKHLRVAEQDGATAAGKLIVYPYVRSTHASAAVICETEVTVREALARPDATVALLVECLGQVDDDQFRARAYEHFRAAHPQTPFLGLHVRGPALGDKLQLDNDAPGQWLDVAHLTESAATSLFGRGSNTALDVYIAAPAALALGIGTRFGPRFWRLRVHNYNPKTGEYHWVYDTADLPEA